jgi:hypothetical protein
MKEFFGIERKYNPRFWSMHTVHRRRKEPKNGSENLRVLDLVAIKVLQGFIPTQEVIAHMDAMEANQEANGPRTLLHGVYDRSSRNRVDPCDDDDDEDDTLEVFLECNDQGEGAFMHNCHPFCSRHPQELRRECGKGYKSFGRKFLDTSEKQGSYTRVSSQVVVGGERPGSFYCRRSKPMSNGTLSTSY